MTQTQENGEKSNLGLLDPNSGSKFFFFQKSGFASQYQKKLMIQSWGNLMTDGQTNGCTDRQGVIS